MLTWTGASPRPSSTRPSPSASHARPLIHLVHAAGGTPASLIWATRIGALATAGLLVGAAVTAIYATKAFGKQSTEAKRLQDQAKRDNKERRRAQVFIVIASGLPVDPGVQLVAKASSTSRQPVYDIEIQWRTNAGPFGAAMMIPLLMPEETTEFAEDLDRRSGRQWPRREDRVPRCGRGLLANHQRTGAGEWSSRPGQPDQSGGGTGTR